VTTTLAIVHPKGGVGRSTTAYYLAAELALREQSVVIEDLDQGLHLSRMLERHPLNLPNLRLGGAEPRDYTILDTAPEGHRERAVEYLRGADWVLIPVKGPEEGSVQALPALLRWIGDAGTTRLLGFLPTMHKPRRAETRYWLGELRRMAKQYAVPVFDPIGDLSSIAAWRFDGRPYAALAEAVLRATHR